MLKSPIAQMFELSIRTASFFEICLQNERVVRLLVKRAMLWLNYFNTAL